MQHVHRVLALVLDLEHLQRCAVHVVAAGPLLTTKASLQCRHHAARVAATERSLSIRVLHAEARVLNDAHVK